MVFTPEAGLKEADVLYLFPATEENIAEINDLKQDEMLSEVFDFTGEMPVYKLLAAKKLGFILNIQMNANPTRFLYEVALR